MKTKNSNKYNFIIPQNITVFLIKKDILSFVGKLNIKSIKIKTKVLILKNTRSIIVTQLPIKETSFINDKKNYYFKNYQKNTLMLINQILNSISRKFKKKLHLKGIGFRVNILNNFFFKILFFRLGYSHQIFIRIPKNLTVSCIKTTKILISGKSFQKVSEFANLIRIFRLPEPYKGKGILYDSEKIVLKLGKKI